MGLLYVLLFLILLIALLLYIIPIKIYVNADSTKLHKYNLNVYWIKPLLRGTMVKGHEGILLKIYLFNNKIYKKNLSSNSNLKNNISQKINSLIELRPKFEKFEASYSFEDPSITGMICGLIGLFASYTEDDNFTNNPDFSMEKDFFHVEAIFEISSIGLISLLLKNRKEKNIKILYENR